MHATRLRSILVIIAWQITCSVFLSIETARSKSIGKWNHADILCFESFHLIFAPDFNFQVDAISARKTTKEFEIKKNYNKFVHSQLITHLKRETAAKKSNGSEWNVALRPFSWLTTWKLQASNRLNSLCHVLWVVASRSLAFWLSWLNIQLKLFNKLKSIITMQKKVCTNEFFSQQSACSLS